MMKQTKEKRTCIEKQLCAPNFLASLCVCQCVCVFCLPACLPEWKIFRSFGLLYIRVCLDIRAVFLFVCFLFFVFFVFSFLSCFVRLEGLFLYVLFIFCVCVCVFWFVLFISNVCGGWGARAFSVQNGHTSCAFLYFSPPPPFWKWKRFFRGWKSRRALITHAHPDEIGFRSTRLRLRDVSIFLSFYF